MVTHFEMPKGRTREVFYAQGECSARAGNTRSPGNEYRMPSFGMGESWQAREFARGFRDQCARMAVEVLSGE